jgi:regulator of RNase E activity RraA
MDAGIKAMQQDARIAVPAVTVHQPGMDGTIIGYALGQLRPGDILVVGRCGDMRYSGFGRRSLIAY